jgi:hypothetical protein
MKFKESKTYGVRLCPDDRELEAKLRQHLGVKTFSALVSLLMVEGARARKLLPPVQPVSQQGEA